MLNAKLVCAKCDKEIALVSEYDSTKSDSISIAHLCEIDVTEKTHDMEYKVTYFICPHCKEKQYVQIDDKRTMTIRNDLTKILQETKYLRNKGEINRRSLRRLKKIYLEKTVELEKARLAIAIWADKKEFTDLNTKERFVFIYTAYDGGEDGKE